MKDGPWRPPKNVSPPMLDMSPPAKTIAVRLARTDAEIEAALRLRYQIFFEENEAIPDTAAARSQVDRDVFDTHADHLIVVEESDNEPSRIVGTYRLLRREAAERCGRFYSSNEFDLAPLLTSGQSVLELGRSCVLAEFRTGPVMQLLWQGIADYITENGIDLMFGCASLYGTNLDIIAEPLSYLHHFHPTPEKLRPRAVGNRYVDMNIVPRENLRPRRVFTSLPPLIKGYLRLGATIGDGAVIDHQFNTTDVCIVVQTHLVTQRYRDHYSRKIQRPMHAGNLGTNLNGNGHAGSHAGLNGHGNGHGNGHAPDKPAAPRRDDRFEDAGFIESIPTEARRSTGK